MFRKVLVANRGEIAVRVIRTLREMGIASVAVYSEADRRALHVRMADEAYPIGPAPSAESYLVQERIIEACKKSGAEAVHPGYGFLSENASFARALEAAGIKLIGPPPAAMEAMGYKTAARDKMIAAGVPVVPGATIDSEADLAKAASEVGYPIMLKAAGGGGGKGMRFVESEKDLKTAYDRARSEARKAFGDDTVYLEKAIVEPRHVEIQVLGDEHGNVVHLFERDCSIQRRHQKVVEETPTPAPARTDELIAKMGDVAVKAAQAVGYFGAGTVEFLMAPDGSFYFLEMNTRLQVEHPITELITGIDLVREQVRVAAGEPLGYGQDDIRSYGHAIQCRVYAEDPATNFMPSPGTIEVLRVPAGPGIRDDSGAYAGAEISSYYDPLVSKLCVWARTREEAVQRMRRALSEYVVTGIRTNLPFHLALMSHEKFIAGDYDTSFIAQHEDVLLTSGSAGAASEAFVVGAAVAQAFREDDAAKQASPPPANGHGASVSPWRLAALAKL